jgi:hypothetical protein
MKKILMLLVIMVALASGCGHKTDNNRQSTGVKDKSITNQSNAKGNMGDSAGNKEASSEKVPVIAGKAFYTGEDITEQDSNNLPFLAVIENIKAARPQSGLSQADIIFETLAEGGIPRCLALFQSHRVSDIGPIRSDRVYFNELASSLKLPFAHCGGSQTAIDQINNEKLMSLNEMINGKYYWRIKTRKMPHNLYTSSDKLSELINKRDYVEKPSFNMSFDSGFWKEQVNKATKVSIRMSGYYTTSYIYKQGAYQKLMNGESVIDKNTGEALKTSNIIIQVTKISPIEGDKKLRVEVNLTGSGKGYVISNGYYKPILWKKADSTSPVSITDLEGGQIKLTPGNTWWEIVDQSANINFNDEIKVKSKNLKRKTQ